MAAFDLSDVDDDSIHQGVNKSSSSKQHSSDDEDLFKDPPGASKSKTYIPRKTTSSDSESDDDESEGDIDDYFEAARKRREASRAAAASENSRGGGVKKNGTDTKTKKRKKPVAAKKKKIQQFDDNSDDDSDADEGGYSSGSSHEEDYQRSMLNNDNKKKQSKKKMTKKKTPTTVSFSDEEDDGDKKMSSSKSRKNYGKKSVATSKTKRKKKDPNAPKNPRTAYTFFTMAIRNGTKEENPDASFGEIQKLMSMKWNALVDKSDYEQQAKDDKTRYQDEMKDYVPPPEYAASDTDDSDSGKGRKKPKSKGRAKKPTAGPLPITNRLSGPLDFGKANSPSKENWKIIMLMDKREFGNTGVFLSQVEDHVNNHFGNGDIHCEQATLRVADYMFVARKYNAKGEVSDERVLPILIERKNVNDLQSCLVKESKDFAPLGFFEAQMYKFQTCGIAHKIFLIEGDEENPHEFSMANATGITSHDEQLKRLKRVKTIRMQVERAEWEGVKCISVKSKIDTISFLIQQLANLKKSSFQNHTHLSALMTMKGLKSHSNEQMKGGTFQEYLSLLKQSGTGPVKAMKSILDPTNSWDRNFINPSSILKKTKSTLEDRAVFWKDSSAKGAKMANNAPIDLDDESYDIPFASVDNNTNNRGLVASQSSSTNNGWKAQSGGIKLGSDNPYSTKPKDPRAAARAAAERRLLNQQKTAAVQQSSAASKMKDANDLIVLDSDDDDDNHGGVSDDDVIVID